MKADVAMKALPVLVLVSSTLQEAVIVRPNNLFPGYGGLKSTDTGARSPNHVLHPRPRVR